MGSGAGPRTGGLWRRLHAGGSTRRPIGLELDSQETKQYLAEGSLPRLLATHGALGFRRVPFASPDDLLSFARIFGDDVVSVGGGRQHVQLYASKGGLRAPLPSDDWHSDNSYNQRPAGTTVLYLLEADTPTSTILCDASSAYDSLPRFRMIFTTDFSPPTKLFLRSTPPPTHRCAGQVLCTR